MKAFINKHFLLIVFSIAGATGGFLYWRFIGCQSGTCPIKSVWYLSTLWGLVMGYLLGSITNDLIMKYKKGKKVTGETETNTDLNSN